MPQQLQYLNNMNSKWLLNADKNIVKAYPFLLHILDHRKLVEAF